MNNAINIEQHKWADYLNRKTAKASRRLQLIWLIAFCFFFGGVSTLLLIKTVRNRTGGIRIEKLSVPSHVLIDDNNSSFVPRPILSEKQYHRVDKFLQSMDSLRSTTAGKIKYDSINKARPGLLDSIAIVKQLYLQQSKSK